ncbi:MAG TPA: Maf family protein [Burkholderiales bacterium]|jgi:septum formation protein|nr:Maf family protein [Burkholderiales bacterium]
MVAPLDRSIYLASRSPRRRELLAQIGVRFHLLLFRDQPHSDPDLDETVLSGESPAAYVERVARAKAQAGWQRVGQRNLPRAPVLAADTTVALAGRILGKPVDRKEAAGMLGELSGKRHEVLTAVVVKHESQVEAAVSISEVTFKALSPEEIRRYLASGEADDKAGAYGIQGRAAVFVAELKGSFSGVMGLPLYETAQLLERLDIYRERRNPR